MNVFVFNEVVKKVGRTKTKTEREKDPNTHPDVCSLWERLKSTSHGIPEKSLTGYYHRDYYNQTLKLLFKYKHSRCHFNNIIYV